MSSTAARAFQPDAPMRPNAAERPLREATAELDAAAAELAEAKAVLARIQDAQARQITSPNYHPDRDAPQRRYLEARIRHARAVQAFDQLAPDAVARTSYLVDELTVARDALRAIEDAEAALTPPTLAEISVDALQAHAKALLAVRSLRESNTAERTRIAARLGAACASVRANPRPRRWAGKSTRQ
jgi:hypothetical protein